MHVLKFGGTSVANADRLRLVSDIVEASFNENRGICVIVSAFSGVTDQLIGLTDIACEGEDYISELSVFKTKVNKVASDLLSADVYESIRPELDQNHKVLENLLFGVKLIQEASLRTKDYILSFGERNCAFVLSHFLKEKGLSAEYVDARKVIKTDDSFGSARVNFSVTNKLIKEHIQPSGTIYVVTGFIGSDVDKNRTTTLGRGGSDFSAAIFAAALDAELLDIWTDVDGVLTSDPRKVTKAYTIPELTYSEAMEMSHFGAKVLYSPTIRPVREKNIPTRIKNTFNPDHPGTLIHHNKKKNDQIISGLSAIKNTALISLEGSGLQGQAGIASRFFDSLARGTINIIMITQASSEYSICVAIMEDQAERAKALLSKEFEVELNRNIVDPIKLEKGIALVAIVGDNMKQSPGVAGRLFNTLGKNGINIDAIAQGSSELNITFAIKQDDLIKGLNTIHDSFFLSEYKTLHVFMIGIGLIGSTLLQQIQDNQERIKKECGLEISIHGISNSKKMLVQESSIGINDYMDVLTQEGKPANVDSFIQEMIELNLANSIFIDNTANEKIPESYGKVLSNNIAISTPNKIALSSGLDNYHYLKNISAKHKTPFNFETNVGAGLPVISTLQNLINSGDKIKKIEAVLSGSLSYIFNNYNSSIPFKDIVEEAQNKGFTEPDPRDDLSGSDVKRKLLILSREAGYNIHDSDIKINGFLSQEALAASDVASFYKVLEANEPNFNTLIKKAEDQNLKLRFIAKFENGAGSISLESVDNTSPFYGLSGSDNMISFTTDRYNHFALERVGDEVIVNRGKKDGLIIKSIINNNTKHLSKEIESNTAGYAALKLLESLGLEKEPIEINLIKNMSIGTGLGSSAASAVAGAYGVNAYLDFPLTKPEILKFCTEGEQIADGSFHADNVGPSLLGGFILLRDNATLDYKKIHCPIGLSAVIIYPHVKVLTKDSRAILSDTVMLDTFIKQSGNLASFVAAMYTSDFDLIKRSLEDFVIEPQRAKLIPNFYDMKKIALDEGALGFSISGAGPSMFALCNNSLIAENILEKGKELYTNSKIESTCFISNINHQGAIKL